jgi:hypothetical protein
VLSAASPVQPTELEMNFGIALVNIRASEEL